LGLLAVVNSEGTFLGRLTAISRGTQLPGLLGIPEPPALDQRGIRAEYLLEQLDSIALATGGTPARKAHGA
jgi:hypothetical protein